MGFYEEQAPIFMRGKLPKFEYFGDKVKRNESTDAGKTWIDNKYNFLNTLFNFLPDAKVANLTALKGAEVEDSNKEFGTYGVEKWGTSKDRDGIFGDVHSQADYFGVALGVGHAYGQKKYDRGRAKFDFFQSYNDSYSTNSSHLISSGGKSFIFARGPREKWSPAGLSTENDALPIYSPRYTAGDGSTNIFDIAKINAGASSVDFESFISKYYPTDYTGMVFGMNPAMMDDNDNPQDGLNIAGLPDIADYSELYRQAKSELSGFWTTSNLESGNKRNYSPSFYEIAMDPNAPWNTLDRGSGTAADPYVYNTKIRADGDNWWKTQDPVGTDTVGGSGNKYGRMAFNLAVLMLEAKRRYLFGMTELFGPWQQFDGTPGYKEVSHGENVKGDSDYNDVIDNRMISWSEKWSGSYNYGLRRWIGDDWRGRESGDYNRDFFSTFLKSQHAMTNLFSLFTRGDGYVSGTDKTRITNFRNWMIVNLKEYRQTFKNENRAIPSSVQGLKSALDPIKGDIDFVKSGLDQHREVQKELKRKRDEAASKSSSTRNVQSYNVSARAASGSGAPNRISLDRLNPIKIGPFDVYTNAVDFYNNKWDSADTAKTDAISGAARTYTETITGLLGTFKNAVSSYYTAGESDDAAAINSSALSRIFSTFKTAAGYDGSLTDPNDIVRELTRGYKTTFVNAPSITNILGPTSGPGSRYDYNGNSSDAVFKAALLQILTSHSAQSSYTVSTSLDPDTIKNAALASLLSKFNSSVGLPAGYNTAGKTVEGITEDVLTAVLTNAGATYTAPVSKTPANLNSAALNSILAKFIADVTPLLTSYDFTGKPAQTINTDALDALKTKYNLQAATVQGVMDKYIADILAAATYTATAADRNAANPIVAIKNNAIAKLKDTFINGFKDITGLGFTPIPKDSVDDIKTKADAASDNLMAANKVSHKNQYISNLETWDINVNSTLDSLYKKENNPVNKLFFVVPNLIFKQLAELKTEKQKLQKQIDEQIAKGDTAEANRLKTIKDARDDDFITSNDGLRGQMEFLSNFYGSDTNFAARRGEGINDNNTYNKNLTTETTNNATRKGQIETLKTTYETNGAKVTLAETNYNNGKRDIDAANSAYSTYTSTKVKIDTATDAFSNYNDAKTKVENARDAYSLYYTSAGSIDRAKSAYDASKGIIDVAYKAYTDKAGPALILKTGAEAAANSTYISTTGTVTNDFYETLRDGVPRWTGQTAASRSAGNRRISSYRAMGDPPPRDQIMAAYDRIKARIKRLSIPEKANLGTYNYSIFRETIEKIKADPDSFFNGITMPDIDNPNGNVDEVKRKLGDDLKAHAMSDEIEKIKNGFSYDQLVYELTSLTNWDQYKDAADSTRSGAAAKFNLFPGFWDGSTGRATYNRRSWDATFGNYTADGGHDFSIGATLGQIGSARYRVRTLNKTGENYFTGSAASPTTGIPFDKQWQMHEAVQLRESVNQAVNMTMTFFFMTENTRQMIQESTEKEIKERNENKRQQEMYEQKMAGKNKQGSKIDRKTLAKLMQKSMKKPKINAKLDRDTAAADTSTDKSNAKQKAKSKDKR